MHTFTSNPLPPSSPLLPHFDNRQTYDGMRRYSDSKLVINAFVRKLATMVNEDEVIVNNVCPGMVATGFDKGLPGWIRVPMRLIRVVVARSVVEGGWALVWASVVVGKETHGKFLNNNQVER
jgi:NAD(P)-dependent dehydrogenase (short-subunit alcohol dehydrogenase family)